MFCPCDCELPYPAMVCYHTPDMGDCPDGVVDAVDFLYIIENWGACSDILCLSPTGLCCEWGDINRDGFIDTIDMLLVLQWWGPFDEIAWREWRCQ